MYATDSPAGAAAAPADPPDWSAGADDPAGDHAGVLDDDVLALAPGWHRRPGGAIHVTPEALERAAAELVLRRGRKGAV